MTTRPRPVTRPMTILLVDDQIDFLRFVEPVLNAHPDLDVVGMAIGANEGLTKLVALEPHLVVLDVQMPEIGGFEAASMLLAERPDTRILMVSASSDPIYETMAYEVGAVGFLNKRHLRPEAVLAVLGDVSRAA